MPWIDKMPEGKRALYYHKDGWVMEVSPSSDPKFPDDILTIGTELTAADVGCTVEGPFLRIPSPEVLLAMEEFIEATEKLPSIQEADYCTAEAWTAAWSALTAAKAWALGYCDPKVGAKCPFGKYRPSEAAMALARSILPPVPSTTYSSLRVVEQERVARLIDEAVKPILDAESKLKWAMLYAALEPWRREAKE